MMLTKVLLILFPLITYFTSDDNLIDWSPERKLTWEDFRGKPNPASTNAALTSSSINVEFGFDNTKLTHAIKCRFDKSLSWGRIRNEYILNHEQGHFDIAEIHARILHKELLDYTFNSKTVNDDINRIYNSVMEKHVKYQKDYDDITNHSLDTAQQGIWNKKIASELKSLEKFADYRK